MARCWQRGRRPGRSGCGGWRTARRCGRCRATPAGSGAWRCPPTAGWWPAAVTDGTVRLWDGQHRAATGDLAGPHRRGLGRGALVPTAGWSPAAARTGRCGCGRPSTGRPLATLQGHTGVVWGVALVRRRPAGGQRRRGRDGAAVGDRHRAATGDPARATPARSGAWRSRADGRLLASGGDGRDGAAVGAGSGRPLATLQGHTGGVWGVALSRRRPAAGQRR